MSAFQSPPHCEQRGHPRSVSTICFPNPWRIASVDGNAALMPLVKTICDLAVLDWHAELGIPWTED